MSKTNQQLAIEIGQNVTDMVSRLLGSGPLDIVQRNAEKSGLPEGKVHYWTLSQKKMAAKENYSFHLTEGKPEEGSGYILTFYLEPTQRGGPVGRITPPPVVVVYVETTTSVTPWNVASQITQQLDEFDWESTAVNELYSPILETIDQEENHYRVSMSNISPYGNK